MIPRHNYHTPAPQQADGFNTFGGWLKRLHVWLFDGWFINNMWGQSELRYITRCSIQQLQSFAMRIYENAPAFTIRKRNSKS